MSVFSNLVAMLGGVLQLALWAYFWIIVARAVMSWVNPDPFNPIVQFLYRVTEPVLQPIRRRLPPIGGLDLSPMIVLLAITILDRFLIGRLLDLALSLE
jgi:YggT family protein